MEIISMLTKAVLCIFSHWGLPSRGWFRSIDLWVMGPARFRCATLLHLTPDGTRTHHPSLKRTVPYTFSSVALQRMVSIHRPLGYGPSTLPLRHSASSHPRWDSNPQSLAYEASAVSIRALRLVW